MSLNILIWFGIACMVLGMVALYALMWIVLFFLTWAQIDDGEYVFASMFAAGLVLWTGIGIVVVGMVI